MSAFPAELTGTWDIDAAHSTVGFAVKHAVVATTRGNFGVYAGGATIDAENPENSSLWVEIVSGHVFQGHERAEFQDGEHLCLTRQDWLSLDAPSVLRTRHTHDLLRQDHLWHRQAARVRHGEVIHRAGA